MAGVGAAIKGAAAAAAGFWGGIPLTLGLLGAARLWNELSGPKPDLDAEVARERLRKRTRDASGDAVIVVGQARVGGRVLFEQEKLFPHPDYVGTGAATRPVPGGGGDGVIPVDDDRFSTRYFTAGLLLSHGVIGGIDRMWLGGREVPLRPGFRATPTTTGLWTPTDRFFRSDYEAPPAVGVVPSEANNWGATWFFQTRLATLRAARDALQDRSAANPPVLSPPANVVLRRLYDEVSGQINALVESGRADIGRPGAINWWLHGHTDHEEPAYYQQANTIPVVRLTWGNGSDADAVRATSPVLTRAANRIDDWWTTDTVKGVGWALLELRTWAGQDDGSVNLYPFGGLTAIPEAEFLVRGDPALAAAQVGGRYWGANPVKFAEWVLKSLCNVPDSYIDRASFDAAATYCDTEVTHPGIAADDPATPDKDHPNPWPVVRQAWFGDNPPSTTGTTPTEEARFIAEFNRRFAVNHPKYYAEGVLSGSMSRDAMLEALGESMAGSFPFYDGQWHARPGRYETPKFTIVEADIVSDEANPTPVTWDVQGRELVNQLKVGITQNRDLDWQAAEVPPVTDPTLVDAHGAYVRDLGRAQLVSSVRQARELLAIRLRVDAYGLRTVSFTSLTEDRSDGTHGFAQPGDYVNLQLEGETLSMRVVQAAVRLASFEEDVGGDTVKRFMEDLTLTERPSNTYDHTFLTPTDARDAVLPVVDPEGTNPATPGGGTVTYNDVNALYLDPNTYGAGARLLTVRGIRTLDGGTLHMRFGAGDWIDASANTDTVATDPTTKYQIGDATGGGKLLSFYTHRLDPVFERYVTFASRTGDVYAGGLVLDMQDAGNPAVEHEGVTPSTVGTLNAVRVNRVRPSAGDLVYRLGSGDWTPVRATDSTETLVVTAASGAPAGFNIDAVTSRLTLAERYLTLAARTGAEQLNEWPKIADITVPITPTRPGGSIFSAFTPFGDLVLAQYYEAVGVPWWFGVLDPSTGTLTRRASGMVGGQATSLIINSFDRPFAHQSNYYSRYAVGNSGRGWANVSTVDGAVISSAATPEQEAVTGLPSEYGHGRLIGSLFTIGTVLYRLGYDLDPLRKEFVALTSVESPPRSTNLTASFVARLPVSAGVSIVASDGVKLYLLGPSRTVLSFDPANDWAVETFATDIPFDPVDIFWAGGVFYAVSGTGALHRFRRRPVVSPVQYYAGPPIDLLPNADQARIVTEPPLDTDPGDFINQMYVIVEPDAEE